MYVMNQCGSHSAAQLRPDSLACMSIKKYRAQNIQSLKDLHQQCVNSFYNSFCFISKFQILFAVFLVLILVFGDLHNGVIHVISDKYYHFTEHLLTHTGKSAHLHMRVTLERCVMLLGQMALTTAPVETYFK